MPTLVIWGEKDTALLTGNLEGLDKYVPQLTIKRIADGNRSYAAKSEGAAQTDSAKRELATGTVEDLNKRLDGYRASLSMLRRLVPERSEVPDSIPCHCA